MSGKNLALELDVRKGLNSGPNRPDFRKVVLNGPKNLKKSPKIRKNRQFDKKIINIYFEPFRSHSEPFFIILGPKNQEWSKMVQKI